MKTFDSTISRAGAVLDHFGFTGPLMTPHDRPDVMVSTPRHLAKPLRCVAPRGYDRLRGYFLVPQETILLDAGTCQGCRSIAPLRCDVVGGKLSAWNCAECFNALDRGTN